VAIMAGVARGQSRIYSPANIGGAVFHGLTALLTLFLLMKALGA